MDTKHLSKIKENEILRKRLSKFMTKFCFRNSRLEDFHTRISNEEMKEIMISMTNNSLVFLSILFNTENSNKIIDLLEDDDQVPEWDDPIVAGDLLKSATELQNLIKRHKS